MAGPGPTWSCPTPGRQPPGGPGPGPGHGAGLRHLPDAAGLRLAGRPPHPGPGRLAGPGRPAGRAPTSWAGPGSRPTPPCRPRSTSVRGPGRAVVNAVLRRVASQLAAGPITWPDPATELSYPDWIVARLARDLGPESARDALVTMNEPAAMTVRADGYVQDRASQLVATQVGAQPGDRILDVCAAPGGKATAIAAHGPDLVVAADVSPGRAALTAANAERLGAGRIATVVADGLQPPWPAGRFDRVLVDAPCSGLGVLRRRPDARWRVQPGDVARLAGLQRRLLDGLAAAGSPRRCPRLQRVHPHRRGNPGRRRLAGPNRSGVDSAPAAPGAVAAGRSGSPAAPPDGRNGRDVRPDRPGPGSRVSRWSASHRRSCRPTSPPSEPRSTGSGPRPTGCTWTSWTGTSCPT